MASTPHDGPWSLPEALQLVRELVEPLRSVGYALGLTGSVLTKGESTHDLDLVLYPLSSAKEDPTALRAALEAHGLKLHVPKERVQKTWRRLGSQDEKHVEVWLYQDRRVDLFFLK